jgi:hypothetical protein
VSRRASHVVTICSPNPSLEPRRADVEHAVQQGCVSSFDIPASSHPAMRALASFAAQEGHAGCPRVLAKHRACTTFTLVDAAFHGHAECLDVLLEYSGADALTMAEREDKQTAARPLGLGLFFFNLGSGCSTCLLLRLFFGCLHVRAHSPHVDEFLEEVLTEKYPGCTRGLGCMAVIYTSSDAWPSGCKTC